jgi:hypothetical protein
LRWACGNEAHRERSRCRRDSDANQQKLFSPAQFGPDARTHDLLDSLPEIGAGDTRDANRRGFHVELADIENPFRIDPRFTAETQDLFVASALSLLHHPLPDPPHEGMEPKDGLHEHMQSSGEIVPATDVTQFVRNNGFHLWWRQTVEHALGQQ